MFMKFMEGCFPYSLLMLVGLVLMIGLMIDSAFH